MRSPSTRRGTRVQHEQVNPWSRMPRRSELPPISRSLARCARWRSSSRWTTCRSSARLREGRLRSRRSIAARGDRRDGGRRGHRRASRRRQGHRRTHPRAAAHGAMHDLERCAARRRSTCSRSPRSRESVRRQRVRCTRRSRPRSPRPRGACREGRVRSLPRFGVKSEEKILRGLALLEQAGGRQLLGHVLPLARAIEARLAALGGVAERPCRLDPALQGDDRRLDFLIAAAPRDAARVTRAFASLPEVAHVHARGETKVLVRLASGIDADLRVVRRESFGAALSTSPLEGAQRALRRIAQGKGLKLNEYGIFRASAASRVAARRRCTRRSACRGSPGAARGRRRDRGRAGGAPAEADRARRPARRPAGADRVDRRHGVDRGDGGGRAAARLEYIRSPITRATSRWRAAATTAAPRAGEAIARIDRRLRGFRVLSAPRSTSQGWDARRLRRGARAARRGGRRGARIVHQSRAETTRRWCARCGSARRHPLHPTARSIGHRGRRAGRRPVIRAAVETGTVLEIDALPDRLDLRDEHVRKAVAAAPGSRSTRTRTSPRTSPAPTSSASRSRAALGAPRRRRERLAVEKCLAQLKDGRRRARGR